jgi:hypothetical protein
MPTNADDLVAWAETGEPTPTDDRGDSPSPVPSPPAEEAVVVHYEGHQCWACNNNIDDNTCFDLDRPPTVSTRRRRGRRRGQLEMWKRANPLSSASPRTSQRGQQWWTPRSGRNSGGVGERSIGAAREAWQVRHNCSYQQETPLTPSSYPWGANTRRRQL